MNVQVTTSAVWADGNTWLAAVRHAVPPPKVVFTSLVIGLVHEPDGEVPIAPATAIRQAPAPILIVAVGLAALLEAVAVGVADAMAESE